MMFVDITGQRDYIAGKMRAYYEANKPLRWWQRRKPDPESCIADDLMLGILITVETTQREVAEIEKNRS